MSKSSRPTRAQALATTPWASAAPSTAEELLDTLMQGIEGSGGESKVTDMPATLPDKVEFRQDYARGEDVGLPSDHEKKHVFPRDIHYGEDLRMQVIQVRNGSGFENMDLRIEPSDKGRRRHAHDPMFMARAVKGLRDTLLREMPVFSADHMGPDSRLPATVMDPMRLSTLVGQVPILGCEPFLLNGVMCMRTRDTDPFDETNTLCFTLRAEFDAAQSVLPDSYLQRVASERSAVKHLERTSLVTGPHQPLVTVPDALRPPVPSRLHDDTVPPLQTIMTPAKRMALRSEHLQWLPLPGQKEQWLDFYRRAPHVPPRLQKQLAKWSQLSAEEQDKTVWARFGPRFQPGTELVYLQQDDAIDQTFYCTMKLGKVHGRHLPGASPTFRTLSRPTVVGQKPIRGQEAHDLYLSCPHHCFALHVNGGPDIEDLDQLWAQGKVRSDVTLHIARPDHCNGCGQCTVVGSSLVQVVDVPDAYYFRLSSDGSLSCSLLVQLACQFLNQKYVPPSPTTAVYALARFLCLRLGATAFDQHRACTVTWQDWTVRYEPAADEEAGEIVIALFESGRDRVTTLPSENKEEDMLHFSHPTRGTVTLPLSDLHPTRIAPHTDRLFQLFDL